MNTLGAYETTQRMGVGYYGEVRQGPDGKVYQWVSGTDGLGNPVGFWRALKRVRGFVKRALPVAQTAASFIPGAGPVVAAGVRAATPYLQRAGMLGHGGLGALYEAPDGSLYRMQGVAEGEELQGFGRYELGQTIGIGAFGEVRRGPDGGLYQWTETVDGLGNPVGFWRKLRRRLRNVVQRALPIATTAASFIPGAGPVVAAGVRAATPVLRRAGVLGDGALGALYQAPDGALYQVHRLDELSGLAADDELRGLDADDELQGLDADDELQGLEADEELQGLDADDELQGLDADDEFQGLDADDELQGLEADEEFQGIDADDALQGLAEEELQSLAEGEDLQGMGQGEDLKDLAADEELNGVDAYVPSSRVNGTGEPDVWKPLW
jgi:hypothetical protein